MLFFLGSLLEILLSFPLFREMELFWKTREVYTKLRYAL